MEKENKFFCSAKEKKGFELALNTVVLMIIAVLVLAFFVFFFAMGSSDFLDTIKGYFSYSNLDSIVSRCNLLADSNSLYNYCCEKVELKYYLNNTKEKGILSCREILDKKISNEIKEMNCMEVKC